MRDSHAFIGDAFRRGAWGALVDRRALADPAVARELAAWPGRAVVAVPDTLTAPGALAAWHRPRCAARVVGITGSNGKTTTREMTVAVAAIRWSVHHPAGDLTTSSGCSWGTTGSAGRSRRRSATSRTWGSSAPSTINSRGRSRRGSETSRNSGT